MLDCLSRCFGTTFWSLYKCFSAPCNNQGFAWLCCQLREDHTSVDKHRCPHSFFQDQIFNSQMTQDYCGLAKRCLANSETLQAPKINSAATM